MNDVPVMFTVPQVCRTLQISRSKVYELMAEGSLPSVQIGRSRRVPHARLLQYLEAL